MPSEPPTSSPIEQLITVMARLRNRTDGCPWDLEQTFRTIAPYTIEEAYEVADAIERDDLGALRDELGDLLLQVVYHSRMAEELGRFDFDDVAVQSAAKMIRRHPHIFAAASAPGSATAQVEAWETIKAAERGAAARSAGTLDGVALALPALTRAFKIQQRAARSGFDWTDVQDVFAKIAEEVEELRIEIDGGLDADRLEDELGDVLFTVVNLSRRLALDPERALKRATAKFTRRFTRMEAMAGSAGNRIADCSAAELDRLWCAVKAEEAGGPEA